MKLYEQVSHTADLAAKIYGKTLEELFSNAAVCMFSMMAEIKDIAIQKTEKIEVSSSDTESLLITWLNELLYIASEKGSLYKEFNIILLNENRLKAQIKGAPVDDRCGAIRKEIKAATYHNIKIEKNKKGYEVLIVFDI